MSRPAGTAAGRTGWQGGEGQSLADRVACGRCPGRLGLAGAIVTSGLPALDGERILWCRESSY